MTLRERQQKLTAMLNDTREKIQKNLREMMDKIAIGKEVEKQAKSLQANLEKTLKLMLLGLNVASRDQIDFLNQRIDMLNEQLEKYAKKSSARPSAKKKAAKKVGKVK